MSVVFKKYLLLPRMSIIIFVIVVLLLRPLDASIYENAVLCEQVSEFVKRECPSSYPVCCSYQGIYVACCPEGSRCDLDNGRCLLPPDAAPGTENSSSASGSATAGEGLLPGGNTTTLLVPAATPGNLEFSLDSASSFLGAACFGFFLLLSLASSYGRRIAQRWEESRVQRELEQRELLRVAADGGAEDEELVTGELRPLNPRSAPGGEDAPCPPAEGGTDAAGVRQTRAGEDEERVMCKVCFARRCSCALLRCGHVLCCVPCARRVALCPICRAPVVSFVKIENLATIIIASCPSDRTDGATEGDGQPIGGTADQPQPPRDREPPPDSGQDQTIVEVERSGGTASPDHRSEDTRVDAAS